MSFTSCMLIADIPLHPRDHSHIKRLLKRDTRGHSEKHRSLAHDQAISGRKMLPPSLTFILSKPFDTTWPPTSLNSRIAQTQTHHIRITTRTNAKKRSSSNSFKIFVFMLNIQVCNQTSAKRPLCARSSSESKINLSKSHKVRGGEIQWHVAISRAHRP